MPTLEKQPTGSVAKEKLNIVTTDGVSLFQSAINIFTGSWVGPVDTSLGVDVKLTTLDFSDVLTSFPLGLSTFYINTGGSPDSGWGHCLTIKTASTRGFQVSIGDSEVVLSFRNQASDGAAWTAWQTITSS